MHACDVIDRFVRYSIMDKNEFEWESQLRFHWGRTLDEMVVRQCNYFFYYGHKYMGLDGCFVITSLIDRFLFDIDSGLV